MEWQERLFEVVHGEAWCGDSGIADWLNELENEEGLEIKDILLAHLGRTPPADPVFGLTKELVFVLVKVWRRIIKEGVSNAGRKY